ncbi:MAG: MFS transporter, partial [Chloroflexi bacterium]|nr:MFS transporter [Chloroflexota bacterium]
ITRLKWSLSVLTPDALRLILATLLTSFPIGYMLIVMPIYFNKVGLDSEIIGRLYAVSSIVSAVLLVVFGVMADRFGRKPFVLAGLALPAVSYALFISTTDTLLLTLAAGIGGIGLAGGLSGALSSAGFNALLAEKTSDADRTLIFSIASAAWTAALMGGSLISCLPEWLQQTCGVGLAASYHPLFWVSLVVTLLGAALVWPVQETHTRDFGSAGSHTSLIPRGSLGAMAKLSLVMGLIGLGLGFSVQLLSLWFYLRFNVSGDFLGPWYAASEALSIPAIYIIPRMARRIGTANTVLVTQGTASLFLVSMIFAPTAALAAALYLVRNFLMNLAWPAQQSYIMGVVEPRERATASSAVFAVWGLANSISPAIAGVWLDQGQLALPLMAGTVSYLLSVALFYGFFRRVRLPEETAPGASVGQPEFAEP